ncbi:hypothetical protein CAL7716_014450 [Calothrix sp. PCC 7716]|nr:hypothetical protein CAL7716_014450 [Calothrix sp. PCC 7716]
MSNENNFEKRLSTLEQIVADIQRKIAGCSTYNNWLEKVGCISDEEAFLQALEYGKYFRYSDRPTDEINEQL